MTKGLEEALDKCRQILGEHCEHFAIVYEEEIERGGEVGQNGLRPGVVWHGGIPTAIGLMSACKYYLEKISFPDEDN